MIFTTGEFHSTVHKEAIGACKLVAMRLQNYKSFVDTDFIFFNKLTMLVGANSSGKTAIRQILEMLVYCYKKMDKGSTIRELGDLKSTFGDINDIRHKGSNEKNVKITFRFTIDEKCYDYIITINDDIVRNGGVEDICLVTDNEKYQVLNDFQNENIFFVKRGKIDVSGNQNKVLAINNCLMDFCEKMREIGASRIQPDRIMTVNPSADTSLNAQGDHTYDILSNLSNAHEEKVIVDKWLEKFGYRYRWESQGGSQGAFILQNIKTQIESNIVDNGFGVSQSLVVATAIACLREQILMIDSPEAFLQTDMQSEMGDLLIDGTKNGSIIVETGSEHLIQRICRRVAEKNILAEDVTLYFVDDNKKQRESVIARIPLAQDGTLDISQCQGYGEFFSSDFVDLMATKKAAREKTKE